MNDNLKELCAWAIQDARWPYSASSVASRPSDIMHTCMIAPQEWHVRVSLLRGPLNLMI